MQNLEQPKLFLETIIPQTTYPGRKGAAGAWQKIISEIPKCELFIEAMCGSGYISSLVQSTGCSIVLNDYDRAVISKIAYAGNNVEFRNEDYSKVIKRYDNGNKGRIFYFDPPYLMETRSYQLPIYKFEWNKSHHVAFLKAMQKMKCPTMISHYPCKMYDQALKKWRKITYNTMTRAGVRKESLYMNFQQPALLQCHNHVGENFTDRQRIKRKIERFMNKLKKEPGKERAAILSSIIEQFDYVISDKKNPRP